MAPKAPGMKYRHYAPNGQVEIFSPADLAAVRDKVVDSLVLATADVLAELKPKSYYELGRDINDIETAAQRLFAALRYCDEIGARRILAQSFAPSGLGAAYMNRLNKAAAKS